MRIKENETIEDPPNTNFKYPFFVIADLYDDTLLIGPRANGAKDLVFLKNDNGVFKSSDETFVMSEDNQKIKWLLKDIWVEIDIRCVVRPKDGDKFTSLYNDFCRDFPEAI